MQLRVRRGQALIGQGAGTLLRHVWSTCAIVFVCLLLGKCRKSLHERCWLRYPRTLLPPTLTRLLLAGHWRAPHFRITRISLKVILLNPS